MPTLNIGDQKINVSDDFLKLSPDKQNDVVAGIVAQLGMKAGPDKKADNGPSARSKMSMPAYDAMGNASGQAEDVDVVEAKPSRFRDQADDIVKSIGGGLVRGTAGLVGTVTDTIPGAINKVADYGVAKLTGETQAQTDERVVERRKNVTFPGVEEAISTPSIQAFLERITGKAHEPQTTAGHFASTAAEFVPGGAIGRLPNIARNAITYGAIPGLASEGAGQAFKDGPGETPARIVGAVGAGIGGAAVQRMGSAERLVSNATRGVTPQQIDQMEALFNQAQQAGTPISRAEALQAVTRGGTGLGDLQHTVEGAGSSLKQFYAQRPAQNEAAARQTFDTIAPPSRAPADIGPAAGRAAEEHVNEIRGRINDASQPFYDRAARVIIAPQEMQQVRALPGYPEAAQAVRNDPQLARYVQGLPENSVGFLNEVKKQLDQSRTNASSPVNAQQNMQRSAGFGQDATAVRDTARRASPDYDTALAIQSGGREQILQPILNGPIGKIAKQDATTKSAIDALFPANPLPNSQGDIAQTVRALSRQRPGVADDLVRAHAELTFQEAAQRLASGGDKQSGGALFAAVLRGNSQQATNLETAVRALPNGGATWQGFNRLLDVMEAQQYRQAAGSRTAFKIPGVEELKTGGLVNNAAQVIGGGGIPLSKKVTNAIQNWNLGRNVDQLANLLTNPASAQDFRRIATLPAGSAQAGALLGRLVEAGERGRASRQLPAIVVHSDE